METKDIEEKTFNYYQSGYNCVEAFVKAFAELNSYKQDPGIVKFATGFGGGIGGTNCETCGALTAGILVIGGLYGRMQPEDNAIMAYELSREYRKAFLKEFNETCCKKLLESLGKQENKMKCKKLTSKSAGILYNLLRKFSDNTISNL